MERRADLRSNMAVRIMHGVVPAIMQDKLTAFPEAQRLAYTIISGAKEIVFYGARAVYRELLHCEDRSVRDKLELKLDDIAAENAESLLSYSIPIFSDKNKWSVMFGGVGWANFAKALLIIARSLKEYDIAPDYESKEKLANNISAYLNVIDGMMHNTGSFIEKMIEDEQRLVHRDSRSDYIKEWNEATRLLNTKQLSHPEDILYILEPYIRNTPEAYEFKRYIVAYRSKGEKPDLNRIRKELAEISEHKDILMAYKETWYPTLSTIMNSKPERVPELTTALEDTVRFSFPQIWPRVSDTIKKTFEGEDKLKTYLIEQFLTKHYPHRDVAIMTGYMSDFYIWTNRGHKEASFMDVPDPEVILDSKEIPVLNGTESLNKLKQLAKSIDTTIRQTYGLG